MIKLFGNKRLIMSLISLIIVIALMGVTLGNRGAVTWPEKMLQDTVAWLQGLIYKPAGYIAGFFEDISTLGQLRRENEVLKRTLSHYARDTARLNVLKAENERLKDLLNFTERQKSDELIYRVARVVAINHDGYNNVFKIDLGANDGIRESMAVVTPEGLIGRVIRVAEFSSNVLMLTDINDQSMNSRGISVTSMEHPDSFGVIESYDHETGYLIMSKIKQEDPLRVGDTVITSGLGGTYPPGLIVGTVVSRREGTFGITHVAEIKPAANMDMTGLREVLVVERAGEGANP
ncbi:cell shape-determining protein MreC [Insulibacter thermoxylanivorax]|uniref:Cell shape-determining protein MreC n=1 Tax=Insulibacter thermoxylanivorax TaxID=2749268 RepID=A0A916QIK0_9BACL|nr:rod shape-determining protein MreC [Insulibacter thermoxylanivorax]GFR39102.1 cell shape-determining protein MreC [Insulibacter thermoxylanivorax]